MHRHLFAFFVVIPWLIACNSGSDASSLCKETFEPYLDLTIGQERNERHGLFLDAMEHYRAGDHARAADSLEVYLERRDARVAARLYLACSYLALQRPFDAELQLDKLEQSTTREFKDQCDWYTVVCWLCSDQLSRALQGAQRIEASGRHTYRREASKLIQALRTAGVE